VVHRDLKPGNVLLSDAWVAKIGDFGAARMRPHVAIETARIGTCQWTAPEVLRQQPHDERADSYSFGLLLYELAARRMPYEGVPSQQVEVGVITGKQPRPNICPELEACDPSLPASVYDVMTAVAQSCLLDDHTQRPLFPEVSTQLQSAANLLLRDSGASEWIGVEPGQLELPPIRDSVAAIPPPSPSRSSSDYQLRLMAERHLHKLLDTSKRLFESEESTLRERRRSSLGDAGHGDDLGSADSSEYDSDNDHRDHR